MRQNQVIWYSSRLRRISALPIWLFSTANPQKLSGGTYHQRNESLKQRLFVKRPVRFARIVPMSPKIYISVFMIKNDRTEGAFI